MIEVYKILTNKYDTNINCISKHMKIVELEVIT